MRTLLQALAALSLAAGCGQPSDADESSTGPGTCSEVGCACDDVCDDGLVCASQICVPLPEGSSSGDEPAGTTGESAETTAGTSGEASTSGDSSGGVTSTESSSTGSSTGSVESSGSTGPLAFCGDGTMDAGEECDDGNDDETDTCLATCVAASCGDQQVQTGVEECDDGDQDNGDGCDNDCTPSWWEHEGVAYDVEIAALKGWTLCWEGSTGKSLIDGLKACPGEHLLVACAPQLEQMTLTMVAHGPRVEFKNASLESPHVVNGSQWVLGESYYGFAPLGVDMSTEGPSLLWGMTAYKLNSHSYCEDFNISGFYRRLLFSR